MSTEMLIRCCAPTMASLKTGNMFNCPFNSREEMTVELRHLNQVLGRKGLRVLPLRWNDGHALVYLFRPKMLEKDLQNDLASQILNECGYNVSSSAGCVAQLITRLRSSRDFPHEVGLFLGYPRWMWKASSTERTTGSFPASGRSMMMWQAPRGSSRGAGTVQKSIFAATGGDTPWTGWP